jgi:hypothetical protein
MHAVSHMHAVPHMHAVSIRYKGLLPPGFAIQLLIGLSLNLYPEDTHVSHMHALSSRNLVLLPGAVTCRHVFLKAHDGLLCALCVSAAVLRVRPVLAHHQSPTCPWHTALEVHQTAAAAAAAAAAVICRRVPSLIWHLSCCCTAEPAQQATTALLY